MPKYDSLFRAQKHVLFLVAFTLSMSAFSAAAAEEGAFTGAWIASGERQLQDFMAGRRVFTFQLHGHMNLKNPLGEVSD